MAGNTPDVKQIYDGLAKDLSITEDLNRPTVAQLSFARDQAEQMKVLVNRLLFDATMATMQLNSAKDENSKTAYESKVSEYKRDLRQTRDGLLNALALVESLSQEVSEQ